MVKHERVISEITQRLVSGFHPVRVILFGSHARGDASSRSDVDVIVLLDQIDDWFETTAAMHRVLVGVPLPCDIVVFTPEEFEIESAIPGSAARYAAKEGMTLYERAA